MVIGEAEEEGGEIFGALVVITQALSKGVTVVEAGATIGAAKGTDAITAVGRRTETS